MLKNIIIIFTLLLSIQSLCQDIKSQLTPKEQTWIDEHPVVYHGYDPEWKPIGFIDDKGKYAGISADYLNLIGLRIGIEFKPYPGIKQWSQSLSLIKNEDILFLPALAQNEERNKYLNFTETYSAYPFVIVNRKNGDFIGGLKDLDGVKVAAPKNYYITGLLKQEQIDMELIYKAGTEECLLAVSTGEAEATVANLTVVSHYLNYSGFENLKIAAPTSYPKIEVKMGVSKNHPELLSILQKGINSVTQKEKNNIIQNWVSVKYEHGVNMTKVWTIAGMSLGLALIIFSVFFYYNRKMKKAQLALKSSYKEITNQKIIIEQKNEEVMASITYAKRLQNAILPTEKQINEALNDSFVLFLPKDIVSGDFYFLETKNNSNNVFFTVADCTGHGVPGAMVSMVCSNALHQAVIEEDLNEPAQVLNSAKANLEKRFARSGENIKDGMDISFCELDKRKKILQWSGANNPLWIVRSNQNFEATTKFIDLTIDSVKPIVLKGENCHLIELKADRQPVGKYEYSKSFSNHIIQLCNGDSIYLFSDGYADQFGGKDGKKFKSKRFKKLIMNLQNESMPKQHDILRDNFKKWKSEFEQIDDVCVFGVKINS